MAQVQNLGETDDYVTDSERGNVNLLVPEGHLKTAAFYLEQVEMSLFYFLEWPPAWAFK